MVIVIGIILGVLALALFLRWWGHPQRQVDADTYADKRRNGWGA